MSIAALYELQERLYNTAIAGVTMINEDFRLQRSIEQFQQAAEAGASPVFKKIAEQLKPLSELQASDKTTALTDALTLIDAVLYTQGATDVSGEPEPVAERAFGAAYYEARYSELHGLKAALTEKGSGRYEVVKSAYDAKSPAFHDFRLRGVLIGALGDSYAEMADLAAEILSSGAAGDAGIVPLLKQNFDPKGKREMARRVEVIEKLARAQENEFYLSLLEKSSAAVRLAAVHALKHDAANAELLMSLAETEKGDVREAAYSALYELKDSDTRAFWLKHAEQSPDEVASYLFDDAGDDLSDIIAGRLHTLLHEILNEPQPYEHTMERMQKLYSQLDSYIYMSTNKASSRLVEVFAELAPLAKAWSKIKLPPSNHYNRYGQDTSSDLLREINLLIVRGIVLNYNERLAGVGAHLYGSCGLSYLQAGFSAALVSQPAAEVYEQFSPFLLKKDTADMIAMALSFVAYDEEQNAYYLYASSFDGAENWSENRTGKPLYEKLDARWLKLLVTQEVRNVSKYKQLSRQLSHVVSNYSSDGVRERYDVMLMGLMNTRDEETAGLLKEHFMQGANEGYSEIPLIALRRLSVTELHELVISIVQQPNYPQYYVQYLCRRLHLPAEQNIAVFESLLALAQAKKLRNRYYTVERLQDTIDRIRTGENVYWY